MVEAVRGQHPKSSIVELASAKEHSPQWRGHVQSLSDKALPYIGCQLWNLFRQNSGLKSQPRAQTRQSTSSSVVSVNTQNPCHYERRQSAWPWHQFRTVACGFTKALCNQAQLRLSTDSAPTQPSVSCCVQVVRANYEYYIRVDSHSSARPYRHLPSRTPIRKSWNAASPCIPNCAVDLISLSPPPCCQHHNPRGRCCFS
jgi:hypothetical protein